MHRLGRPMRQGFGFASRSACAGQCCDDGMGRGRINERSEVPVDDQWSNEKVQSQTSSVTSNAALERPDTPQQLRERLFARFFRDFGELDLVAFAQIVATRGTVQPLRSWAVQVVCGSLLARHSSDQRRRRNRNRNRPTLGPADLVMATNTPEVPGAVPAEPAIAALLALRIRAPYSPLALLYPALHLASQTR
jgi:hypothetical protein